MTGFLDRLLHADKSRPLDIDAAAAMLRTTPGLLREFERSYHANVPDRSICGAFVKDTDIATELPPVSPTLTLTSSPRLKPGDSCRM